MVSIRFVVLHIVLICVTCRKIWSNDESIQLFSGMTGSGKTTFVCKILEKRLITNFPEKIIYFYKVRQPFMDKWNSDVNKPKITFIDKLDLSILEKDGKNSVVIIDDYMMADLKTTADLFICGSRHLNITTFFLCHNLFPNDNNFRLMSLNASYFILACNLRSMKQIKTFAQQSFTKEKQMAVTAAYKSAMTGPFGFIVLTFVQELPKELTVCSNFWDNPSFWL